MVNKIVKGGLITLALTGVIAPIGCENTRVIDKEKERAEVIERSNYHLTKEINQMVVFDAYTKNKHRMLYGEFLAVTGIERKFSAEYDNLPVRIDVTKTSWIEQELDENDSGFVGKIHLHLPAHYASDVHTRLSEYFEK